MIKIEEIYMFLKNMAISSKLAGLCSNALNPNNMKKYICIQDYTPRYDGDITIPQGAEVMINITGYRGIGLYDAIYDGIVFDIAGFSLSSHFLRVIDY